MESPAAPHGKDSDVRERNSQTSARPAGPLQLSKQELHVWRARLDVEPAIVRRLSAHLSQDEIERAERFAFEKDRVSFKVARGILRELLGEYLRQAPATICFETGARGKPAVCTGSETAALRFNVSHSHGLALYAFALEREVGVDVEKIRPQVAFEGIEERYFSAREVRELRALPEALRAEGFFLCWTRKEAYIKARGEGLHIPLESFDVSLTPGALPVLSSGDREKWSLYSLSLGADFAGAVVVEGRENQLRFWEWRASGDYE
jgi:4'-phosphopantetheinyl transferase